MTIYKIYIQRTVIDEARIKVEASDPAGAYYAAWGKYKAGEFHSHLSVKSDETTMCGAIRITGNN